MIWREGYSTEVVRGFAPPGPLLGLTLDGSERDALVWPACLLCSKVSGLLGLEVWWRLADQAGIDVVAVALGSVAVEEASAVVPSSRHARTLILESPDWESAIAGKPAAYVPGAQLLMLGPPTEEAWDEFEQAVRTEPRAKSASQARSSSLPPPQPPPA